MQIDRTEQDGVTIVTIADPGEIDVSKADAFRTALLYAARTSDRVVVDCSHVEFFDSAGMAVLLTLQREVVGRRKGRLALAGVSPAVQDIFRMVGFDSVLVWHADVPQAVAAVRG